MGEKKHNLSGPTAQAMATNARMIIAIFIVADKINDYFDAWSIILCCYNNSIQPTHSRKRLRNYASVRIRKRGIRGIR